MPDERGRHHNFKYSDEELIISARKFDTRGAWKLRAKNQCQAARTRPIWNECVAHMKPASNPFAHDYIIYAYLFSDRHCYVGLTFKPEHRKANHALKGPVFEHMKVCPKFDYVILESGLTCIEAIAAEEKWQAKHLADGWMALHTAKAGCLGTIKLKSKWTKETVMADAAKYPTKQAWIDNSQGSYRTAKREGWFEEATARMPNRDARHLVGRKVSAKSKKRMRRAKLGVKQTRAHRRSRARAVKAWWADRRELTPL